MITMLANAGRVGATAAARNAGLPGKIGGAAHALYPCYGLTSRFTVELGHEDISDWSACTGLRVEYKTLPVPQIGNAGPIHLPVGPVYKNILLRRGIDRQSSAKLQDWLRREAWAWIDGGSGSFTDAYITLYGPDGKLVARWVALNVRPVAWSGPDLDAGKGQVAVETLELAHEGLRMITHDNKSTPTNDSLGSSPGKLTLKPGAQTSGPTIHFFSDPTEISVKYNSNAGVSVEDNKAEATTAGVTQYTLNSLFIDGEHTQTFVKWLTHWSATTSVLDKSHENTSAQTPATGKSGGNAGPAAKIRKRKCQLKLNWGTLFRDDLVHISSLNVSYIRFDATGQPTRAKVTLTLEDWDRAEPPSGAFADSGPAPRQRKSIGRAYSARGWGQRNPHSGGIPGRRTHTMVLGEELATLARETYGAASRWRDIAEANAIDDPRRLRPGTVLYLPALGELKGE